MISASAFAPANLSLVFQTYDAENSSERGSLGIGFTLTSGVCATAMPAQRNEIRVGDENWEFPTVAQVVRSLTARPLRIDIQADHPFGCGFGMSGASALAAAYAVDQALELHQTEAELNLLAHVAEVENATGLGDVGGQVNGGIMIKSKPLHPLEVEKLPIPPREVHVRVLGPISTREVISSEKKLQKINRAGKEIMRAVVASDSTPDFERLLQLSRQFAERSGLLQSERLRHLMDSVTADGGQASMIMLGEALVATIPFAESQPVQIGTCGVRRMTSCEKEGTS